MCHSHSHVIIIKGEKKMLPPIPLKASSTCRSFCFAPRPILIVKGGVRYHKKDKKGNEEISDVINEIVIGHGEVRRCVKESRAIHRQPRPHRIVPSTSAYHPVHVQCPSSYYSSSTCCPAAVSQYRGTPPRTPESS